LPVAVLAALSLAIFAGFYLIDNARSGGSGDYLTFDGSMITDALPALAGLTAAVLGIVITVVSIIVQLSNKQYTTITQMFLRDRVNIAVMAYFVIACVTGVWLSMAVQSDFVPRAAILAMLIFTTVGLVVMLPYPLLRFLEPQASSPVSFGPSTPWSALAGNRRRRWRRRPACSQPWKSSPTSRPARSGKDKIIASRAVDAIEDFVVGYPPPAEPAAWFTIGEGITTLTSRPWVRVARDPVSRRTWVRGAASTGIYRPGAMPDISYLVAIDTRASAGSVGLRRRRGHRAGAAS
jgi:hypothetical protein